MSSKILIIGGVAGGATAAARLRRLDEKSEIILFEREEHISFANCGLPYYIGGTIKSKEDLLVQTVEGMANRYNIDIRNKSEVKRINRQQKFVEVINLETSQEYKESYDYLVLSPGAKPVVPPITGLTAVSNVFTLRNIPDTEKILQHIKENNCGSAMIVGGGFIGLEMAENLRDRNLEVVMVEASDQVQPSIDYEMACILHSHLKDKGVKLLLNDSVVEVQASKAILKSGREIKTDLIIISIGVQPENKLALEAGLELGERGSIRVNEYLQTSDQDIYAIGDVIEVKNYISGLPTHIPLAWPANRQGRLVADNIHGKLTPYKGTLGTSVAKVFDLTVASTGLTEKTVKKLKYDYHVVHIHPNSHAGYYPGAFPISLKMVFGTDGRILGVQGVGVKGVEKRIDVIATAIKGRLSVYDLQELELAYAPPYSSAKDPVNMLGYVASNIINGSVKTIQYHEIAEILKAGNALIDVRQPSEVRLGKIDGSINIPLDDLRNRLGELPNETIYIYCQVGLRGYLATRILEEKGYEAFNLDGGYKTYSSVYIPREKVDDLEVIDDTGEIINVKK
ncbi:MAG: CoA-disulfide reductase [Gracilibacter sp. BRH_c7a]|nr:MAG: CoA-disulfide reductase [Gracilibacter sp. BRH_c7a]